MQRILITGANRGIGYSMTQQLLEDGHQVCVLDIETESIGALKQQYQERLLTYTCDITDTKCVEASVEAMQRIFGGVEIGIHNACLCTFESFEASSLETFNRVMDVNFLGAVQLTKAVLPAMKAAGQGRVIYLSSGVGVTGFSNISPYAASKGAIEALAKCMRLEYAGTGISFHLMHPPLTKTISASQLPVPEQMKADPELVGRGLARQVLSKQFVITHSAGQAAQIWASYRMPLSIGKMMDTASKRFGRA